MSGAGTGPAPFPSLAAARATWLLERYSAVSVIVVGDVMLDQFVVGHVRRISPEAPVPVVEFERDEFRIGGAANVAHNIAALGARAELVGVVGADAAGERLTADAGANLMQGVGEVAKAKAASMRDAAAERIADTTGGKIAAAIRASAESDQAAAVEAVPTFGGNNLAGADSAAADPDDEVAAFANREHGKSEA